MANRITIQLVGISSDKHDVRLDDFIDQLKSIKKALHENELAISGSGHALLDYKIVDLRHSSPSSITLEPVSLNGTAPPAALISDVVKNFSDELKLIKREGKLLTEPDLARLQAYQHIGVTKNNRIEKVKIRVGRSVVTIDNSFKEKLDVIIGPDEINHGTVAGMLEAVNVHKTNKFTIYPTLGPARISGRFPPRIRQKVKDAIGDYVTVFGKLHYKAWSPYPHTVIAEDIDIHEPESELPTLSQLRGMFAGSTGKMNSAEFVDHLRYEDW